MQINEFREKYEKYLIEGEIDENNAARLIESTLGGKCYNTTPEVNIKCHTDIIWESPKGYTCSIDKKAQKKISRGDSVLSKNSEWFEIQNVNGGNGSAVPMVNELKKFGFNITETHDYIMQETDDRYLFLQRCKLLELIKNNCDIAKPVHKNPKKTYIPYQRQNRQDIIVLVPIEDLKKIKHFEILK